jgi:hypothetical protein
MQLVHRRIAAGLLLAWAPPMVLAALQGRLAAPGLTLPLLQDVGFHLRFLVVVPLLIAAELVVHRQLRPLIDQFQVRGLVPPSQAAAFGAALGAAVRWRNSKLAEGALLAAVYAVGLLFTMRRYAALGDGAWFTAPGGRGLSLAGFWLVFVSLPLLQFLLLRWYYRLLVWAMFLWRVSRLDLDLNATHPDKAGGVGFLGGSMIAFVPLAMAHGVLFTGMIADRIFFAGAELADFKMEVFGGGLFLLAIFAGPLTVFGPLLARVKRRGLREYGAVGQGYVRAFRDKWMVGAAPADEPLLGSGDIQSLADLGNSFASAEEMRIAPIRLISVGYFLAAFLAPILPLALTSMSAEKLISRLVGLVF